MKQEMMGWQWHQLDHMQIICTSLQTDNHANTSSLNFYRPLLTSHQQCQSTEGKILVEEQIKQSVEVNLFENSVKYVKMRAEVDSITSSELIVVCRLASYQRLNLFDRLAATVHVPTISHSTTC